MKAKGVGAMSPLDIQRQPDQARQAFVDNVNAMKLAGVRPMAISAVLGAAIPKESGGCRVFGLVPMTRKLRENGACDLFFERVVLFHDLIQFYDAVSFVLLVQAGLNSGFPPNIFLLEVGMYFAPRPPKKGQVISDAIDVARSIVAGSGHCVLLAKVMLHGPLGSVHRPVPPAGLWSYIGGVASRAEGSKQKVIADMEAAADVMAA
ncbi:unnamed protein product, partial [Prorocentrum cordatum]